MILGAPIAVQIKFNTDCFRRDFQICEVMYRLTSSVFIPDSRPSTNKFHTLVSEVFTLQYHTECPYMFRPTMDHQQWIKQRNTT